MTKVRERHDVERNSTNSVLTERLGAHLHHHCPYFTLTHPRKQGV